MTRTRKSLRAESVAWWNAAQRSARGQWLWSVINGPEMGDRFRDHSCTTTSDMPFNSLSRSLVCLWLALECEDEAKTLRPERGEDV